MVHKEIYAIEKELWARVKETAMEQIQEEDKEWVMDPSTTVGRVFTYERLMMEYWFMKNIMDHVTMEGESKHQGD